MIKRTEPQIHALISQAINRAAAQGIDLEERARLAGVASMGLWLFETDAADPLEPVTVWPEGVDHE